MGHGLERMKVLLNYSLQRKLDHHVSQTYNHMHHTHLNSSYLHLNVKSTLVVSQEFIVELLPIILQFEGSLN
jgi:hypothetical protein